MGKLISKIFWGLNIIAASALLVSYLAAFVSPSVTVIPSFFGLAYPYILLANMLFIILWGIKLRKEVILSVIIILIGLTHFNNYFRFGRETSSASDFKLLSYNVRLFNQYEDKQNSEADIIGLLLAENPEIICLQEFYIEGQRNIHEAFTKFLPDKYYNHVKVVNQGRYGLYGIITLSIFPIVASGDIVHPKSSSLTIYTDLLIGPDTVRLYNNHLQSFRLSRMEHSFLEEISGINTDDPGVEIRNLSVSLKEGFIQRAAQSVKVREHIENSPYPVIICGDFNDTPVSYSYRKIRKELKDAFVAAGHGAGFTYRGIYPPNRIDYILFNKTFKCTGFETERVRFSDHYPVIAHFKISGQKADSQDQHSLLKE